MNRVSIEQFISDKICLLAGQLFEIIDPFQYIVSIWYSIFIRHHWIKLKYEGHELICLSLTSAFHLPLDRVMLLLVVVASMH